MRLRTQGIHTRDRKKRRRKRMYGLHRGEHDKRKFARVRRLR